MQVPAVVLSNTGALPLRTDSHHTRNQLPKEVQDICFAAAWGLSDWCGDGVPCCCGNMSITCPACNLLH
ncbi:hypothetical protein FKM82_009045 [Ascaphus truei]